MFINKRAFSLWCVSIGSAAAFSNYPSAPSTRIAFIGRTSGVSTSQSVNHAAGCSCPACTSIGRRHPVGCPCSSCISAMMTHASGCLCPSCIGNSRRTILYSSLSDPEETTTTTTTTTTEATAADVDVDDETVEDDVPSEVIAMDGVETEDEAHNVERPARQHLRKKKIDNEGTDLNDLQVGSTIAGTVKSITSYGAFVDIGATTDGLLHISQLSTEFVGDVTDVVNEGQEVQVRIVSVDTNKGQVGLSLITEDEAAASEEAARQSNRPPRRQQQQTNRRDDSPVLSSLKEKGWDTSAMVEGTVVNTLDFGAFVKIDASQLNSECEGEFDGLVHISALRSGRVGAVTDVVSPDEKVQVRVKSIDGKKVSLTMLSVEEEESKAESVTAGGGGRGGAGFDNVGEGAKDWKEILVKFGEEMPSFQNYPVIEDRKK